MQVIISQRNSWFRIREYQDRDANNAQSSKRLIDADPKPQVAELEKHAYNHGFEVCGPVTVLQSSGMQLGTER